MPIREMTKQDFLAFWPCFKETLSLQETYAFDPQMPIDVAYSLWCESPDKTFVYERAGKVVGSYYIKKNAEGPGSHVCNCGYMVAKESRGLGIARKMAEHSFDQARQSGFRAMQFNSVVSTNEAAVLLWQKLGFTIVGTLPKAYQHRTKGLVDTFVMHKFL
ncbi:ribosomal protein S18 acetylase RimI-like enzyme [Reinekea marinisedimentorum]|uniref:Ribosomal protein S18 acetylase RimI-like enzyme n=2 Tax=Reinekea marinisedimentorum TaxID=230495 RepID=A0A4R3I5G2_9GAMM|nr:ribosomal protein S18 acetylase RimI-like enzyme [Reinekea marinisedimentorum]